MIRYNEKEQVFHISTKNTSYLLGLHKGAYPVHLHWGKRVYGDEAIWSLEAPYRRAKRLLTPEPGTELFTMEYLPMEYPSYGTSDFRPSAFQVRDENGDRISDARYVSHEIVKGSVGIPGLPACYAAEEGEAETLILTLHDDVLDLDVKLYYTAFEHYDAVTRHTEFVYHGEGRLYLENALSVSIDRQQGYDEMIVLHGTALREKHMSRRPVGNGMTSVESLRGISSHQQSPFAAMVDKETTEHNGNAWGVTLAYSGNFIVRCDSDCYAAARLQAGLHPDTFCWELSQGGSFHTPEAILVYSHEGLNGMSQRFHKLFLERLARGNWKDKERPVLLNTWEACYFDFTHDKVVDLAKAAKKAGMELLVMDDGWFGHRNSANSSLGDWYVNMNKLPKGLKGLADEINAEGLKLGIWFEPEMISPDSDLYRAHPDWCIHVKDRVRTTWRDQLYLDLARDEVADYVIESLTEVLGSANIEYVKWDNNRRITEPGSASLPPERKGELFHRYVLNLYRILETVTSRFPNVLFENCASGGARFDAGMMYYFSQTWASDNTDATSRLKIQYGTSLLMPPLWITSHISASPNHQLERETPLRFRENVCMPFNKGYELNLLKLPDEELQLMAEENERYRAIRRLVQFGTFTRLESPFAGEYTAWQTAMGDETMVWFYKPQVEAEEAYIRVYPVGLEEEAMYLDKTTGKVYNGAMIMNMGLTIDWANGDHFSQIWHLVKQ
ncbi:MAG: alpha-galactosidase [Eubacteriales bacterium]|nr:alpha-galactosidase [Eubacteriales bacterium]